MSSRATPMRPIATSTTIAATHRTNAIASPTRSGCRVSSSPDRVPQDHQHPGRERDHRDRSDQQEGLQAPKYPRHLVDRLMGPACRMRAQALPGVQGGAPAAPASASRWPGSGSWGLASCSSSPLEHLLREPLEPLGAGLEPELRLGSRGRAEDISRAQLSVPALQPLEVLFLLIELSRRELLLCDLAARSLRRTCRTPSRTHAIPPLAPRGTDPPCWLPSPGPAGGR